MKLRKKNKLYIFCGIILVFILLLLLKKLGKNNPTKSIEVTTQTATKTITQTPVPPTPTPTLTKEQIAEIERKKFVSFNEKYGPCKYVPILMYHHILDPKIAKDILATNLNVAPETFRSQIDYLSKKGYQIIGLEDMVSGIKNNSLTAKPIVLTFDDGYNDFYDNVFPILREKNIKATVFVISQFVGGDRYLNWGQVKEMSDSGLVLMGNHTLNHLTLSKLSLEEEKNQILSANKIIEDHIGKKVSYFAYPYGISNQNAKDILKENNFLGAVTTVPGRTQCLGLPFDLQRIRIGAGSLSNYGL